MNNFSRPHVCTVLLAITLGVGLVAAPAHATLFTNPTTVNLLEKWNPDLTYGLPVSNTLGGEPRYGVDYFWLWQAGGQGTPAGAGGSRSVTYTFPAPITINKTEVYWRNTSESPSNYTWSYVGPGGSGTLVTNSSGPYNSGPAIDTFAPTTVTQLTLTSSPSGTNNGTYTIQGIGAYAAPGQNVAIDGTYNLFSEPFTVTQNNGGEADWTARTVGTGLLIAGSRPQSTGGSITYRFNQAFWFSDAAIELYNSTSPRPVQNLKIEVSMDGITWRTAYFNSSYGPNEFANYGLFTLGAHSVGQFVRLSWTDSTNNDIHAPDNLNQFQIFGIVPEPASVAMLVLGGLTLLRRRK